jgi:hypothetical protein
LDCRHVCKTCGFHDALQAGKQKEVRSRQMAPTVHVMLCGAVVVDVWCLMIYNLQ